MPPKVFISYATSRKTLAQRLKDDLARAGCDPWQFDLSAVPGTDAWQAILERIETSDFLVALLSVDAAQSRPVQEEIAYAHYCSVNDAEGKPRIVPLILEDNATVPRQIVRAVRLSFREERYNNHFERLLSALGIEQSPFSSTDQADFTFTRGKEFDVRREAELYASSLVYSNRQVAETFNKLTSNAQAAAGGRWHIPLPEIVTWEANTWRDARRPQFVRKSEFKFLVVFPLRCGFSSGYEVTQRVAMEIAAFDELKYDHVGEDDLVLHSDTLRLKFEGFRDVAALPVEMVSG